MKIHSVKHKVPDLVLDNEQAIALFKEHNRKNFTQDQIETLEKKIRSGLELTGIQKRHITPPDLPVGQLALQAANEAIAESGFTKDTIDMVIYVGIGRGWLEPSMASWVQHELSLQNSTGFDILDACASWMRGLEAAQNYLDQGTAKRILLVNSEAGMSAFADLSMTKPDLIEKTFAIFTVGEAATATILSNESPDHAHIRFRSYPEGFDLCLIPLSNAGSYAAESVADLEADRFYAVSDKLVSATIKRIIQTYKEDSNLNHGQYDVLFSHSASGKAIEIISRQLGLSIDKYISTHENYGNTSSASIPLAMSIALQDGRLKRGDRVLAVVGSAGITVGLASFTF